jgi:hypothetical protein
MQTALDFGIIRYPTSNKYNAVFKVMPAFSQIDKYITVFVRQSFNQQKCLCFSNPQSLLKCKVLSVTILDVLLFIMKR